MFQEIKEQTGVEAEELKNLPNLPVEAAHIWSWFCKLGGARSAGFQVNPISWADVQAYFQLIKVVPERWELDAISDLDNAFLMSRLDSKGNVVKGARALKQKMSGKAAE